MQAFVGRTVAKARKSHRARFAAWRNLDGKTLLTMATLVETDLVRPLLDSGFEWADFHLGKN